MHDATDLLQQGQVDAALDRLHEQVREAPGDAKLRTFLFQLLAVNGEWQRAGEQLTVAGELDHATLAMVQTYRQALNCEPLREEVFAGHLTPLLFDEPDPWIAMLVEALQLQAAGRIRESQALRAQAFDLASASQGIIDGTPFTWLADADPRLGPVLECIINGRYYWVPMQHIRTLLIDPPADLRDVVWMPCHFVWQNGGDTVGLIPTRYPGSHLDADPAIRLSRKTTWKDLGEALFVGTGQWMLSSNDSEYPLMDVRRIDFEAIDSGSKQDEAPATTRSNAN